MSRETLIQVIKQDDVVKLSQLINNVDYLHLIRNAVSYESLSCLEYLIDQYYVGFNYLHEKGLPSDVIKEIKSYSFRKFELGYIPVTLIGVLDKLFKVALIYPQTFAIKNMDDDLYNNTSILFYAIMENNMDLFSLLIQNGFKMNMQYIWVEKGHPIKIYPYTFCSNYGYYHWLDIISSF